MNLLLLILIPLLTAVALLLPGKTASVKWIALAGSGVQLIIAFILLFAFNHQRYGGDTAQMLFQQHYKWFPAWRIGFHIGVDGISVAMILLTAFVVLPGCLFPGMNKR